MSNPTPRDPNVDYETKVETIIMQDRSGHKRYEKLLKDGWEVESVTARKWARGQTYLFRRPRRFPTAGQAAGSAAGKLLNKMIDTSPEGMERTRQKQQENKEALAREREKTKAIIAERKEYWSNLAANRKEKMAAKKEQKAARRAAKSEEKRD